MAPATMQRMDCRRKCLAVGRQEAVVTVQIGAQESVAQV